ncbi:MAG TPA: hypothetical protein VK507_13225 [Iamia sp.]|nr:hypothetical protein [Iamia sp.]
MEQSDSLLLGYFDGFDIFEWVDTDDRFLRRKAFAEFALYLSIAQVDGLPPLLDPLAQLTTSVCNSVRFRQLLLRHQKEFLLFSSPLMFCTYAGTLEGETREVVDRVLGGRQVWSLERAPNRMMDMWNFCQAYGHPQATLVPEEIIRFGVPGFIDPLGSNLRDAYAYTHHFLFYYNFGIPDPAFSLPPLPVSVGRSTDALILRYISENNCDIVAELVLIGLLHGEIDPEVQAVAVGWLLAKVDQHGFVPGPGIEEGDITSTDWRNHYHTVLVSAALFRLLLRSRDAEPSRQSTSADEGGILRSIGDVYNLLAGGEIPLAIATIEELNEGRARASGTGCHDDLLALAVHYVRDLEYAPGEFGFWVDEETVFRRQGRSSSEFQAEIVRPFNQMCAALLAQQSEPVQGVGA